MSCVVLVLFTRVGLPMLAGPCRLPSIYRLNLQQVRAFGLTVKYGLSVDEPQLWVDTEILMVPAAILQQGVRDLGGGGRRNYTEGQMLKLS